VNPHESLHRRGAMTSLKKVDAFAICMNDDADQSIRAPKETPLIKSDNCFDFIALIGEEIEAIARTDPVLTISGISNGNYLVQISIVNDIRATPTSIPP
jgi:hypothetical protein